MRCRKCKTNFNPKHGNKKFCSDECYRLNRRMLNRNQLRDKRAGLKGTKAYKKALIAELNHIIRQAGDWKLENTSLWQRFKNK